jgi:hypothetical protein
MSGGTSRLANKTGWDAGGRAAWRPVQRRVRSMPLFALSLAANEAPSTSHAAIDLCPDASAAHTYTPVAQPGRHLLSILARMLRYGAFESEVERAHHMLAFVELYSQTATPFTWLYTRAA